MMVSAYPNTFEAGPATGGTPPAVLATRGLGAVVRNDARSVLVDRTGRQGPPLRRHPLLRVLA